jgi:hypothetical protein
MHVLLGECVWRCRFFLRAEAAGKGAQGNEGTRRRHVRDRRAARLAVMLKGRNTSTWPSNLTNANALPLLNLKLRFRMAMAASSFQSPKLHAHRTQTHATCNMQVGELRIETTRTQDKEQERRLRSSGLDLHLHLHSPTGVACFIFVTRCMCARACGVWCVIMGLGRLWLYDI